MCGYASLRSVLVRSQVGALLSNVARFESQNGGDASPASPLIPPNASVPVIKLRSN